jgi:gamma-glutamyl:cysteine ligase YbdK (ATP-grasp superfamily)
VGAEIQNEHFSEADRLRFRRRLDNQLRALECVLQRPGFGRGARTLGVELELCLVDESGRAFAISEELVREANTPEITPEMGVFDIELSTPPVGIAGAPFSTLREHMQTTVRQIVALADRHGGRAVPISILPTLREDDFHSGTITNLPRYRALARGMRAARRGPFEIAIEGLDSLHLQSHDAVAMEAANTAFQVHLSTSPSEFASLFNAALLLTGPVLAAAANSPTFLGKTLWDETRVALFKQAGDDRPVGPDADIVLPPRVNFGNSWVREGAHELFMESVALHPPLLPECGPEEDSLSLARANELPLLTELRLHHGTVWSWNRPVYDPSNGGGLRIELRALPAGPSYDDMLANAAFLLGTMLNLAPRMQLLTASLPFALAKQNFNHAAQHGLGAELAWPSDSGSAPHTVRARDLLLALIPHAHDGLVEAGVDTQEAARFLSVFEARVRSGQTGAVWQRTLLHKLKSKGVVGELAFRTLLDRYIDGFRSLRPVHTWSTDPEAREDGHV